MVAHKTYGILAKNIYDDMVSSFFKEIGAFIVCEYKDLWHCGSICLNVSLSLPLLNDYSMEETRCIALSHVGSTVHSSFKCCKTFTNVVYWIHNL